MNRDPEREVGDDASTIRHEEEVVGVDTPWRGIGHVRARKRIVTERVRTSVPREVETVELARAPVAENDSGETETLPDGSISIPVYEEEVVVTKRKVLRERVIVRKQTVTEQQRVRVDLQKERVEVEADEGVGVYGEPYAPAYGSPPRELVETRPFYLTSEFLAFAAVALGIVIAALTDALDATTAAILAVVAAGAYVVSRGFAKASSPHPPLSD